MDWIIQLFADTIVFILVAIAAVSLLILVPRRQKFTVYSRMVVAGLTSYLIAKLMGLAWQPSDQRPFELLGVEPGASYLDNPGFPSDHALFVWVIVFAVWYGTRHRTLTLICAAIALLVSVGRVLALVHAPIDVIGGFLAAGVGALWYVDTIRTKKLAKK